MKTLISVKNEQQEQEFSCLIEKNENLLLFQESGDLSELKKLQAAAKFADTAGCDLLIDAPEDIKPENIQSLLDALSDDPTPTELLVACSNNHKIPADENKALLMLQLLTGEKICGFRNKLRVYPVKLLSNAPCHFYENELFYTKILIRGTRSGYKARNIEISDYAPEPALSIPRKRYFICELFRALRPWPTKRLCERNFQKEKFKEFLCHPIKFLKFLLMENATPGGLAAAAATGMFLGTLPLLGFHTAAIIYVSIKLRLNKVLSVNISHLCMPPFIPIACIEIGYYIRNGKWLSNPSFETMIEEIHLRLIDWILGALILAPINAIAFALITYTIAATMRATLGKKKKNIS